MIRTDSLLQGEGRSRDAGLAIVSAGAWLLLSFLLTAVVFRPPVLFPPQVVDVKTHRDALAVADELVRLCPLPDGQFSVRVPRKWKVRWHESGNHLVTCEKSLEDGFVTVGFDGGGKPKLVRPRTIHLLEGEIAKAYAPGKIRSLKPLVLDGLPGAELVVDAPKAVVHQLEFHEAAKRYVFSLTVPPSSHANQVPMLYGIAASLMRSKKI